ncbi:MAG: hypothetical protein ACPL1Y_02125 [Thermoplasmata archaeon]
MPEKNSVKYSNLADPRMQKAILLIFERPCVRLRTLSALCEIPKSSIHRKLQALDYVKMLSQGGCVLEGMKVDVALFNALENQRLYRIAVLCTKPLTLQGIATMCGRNENSVRNSLRKLMRLGIIRKNGKLYTLNPLLQKKYSKLRTNFHKELCRLGKILEIENLEHTIIDNERVEIVIMGKKYEIHPYERLRSLL